MQESKHNTVLVSFETFRQRVEDDVTVFISARRKGLDVLLEEIKTACSGAKRMPYPDDILSLVSIYSNLTKCLDVVPLIHDLNQVPFS